MTPWPRPKLPPRVAHHAGRSIDCTPTAGEVKAPLLESPPLTSEYALADRIFVDSAAVAPRDALERTLAR